MTQSTARTSSSITVPAGIELLILLAVLPINVLGSFLGATNFRRSLVRVAFAAAVLAIGWFLVSSMISSVLATPVISPADVAGIVASK